MTFSFTLSWPELAFWSTYLLWWLFLGIMSLRGARIRGVLTLPAHIAGFPGLIFGYFMDWLVNVFWTLVFWDFPASKRLTLKFRRWSWTTPPLPLEIVTARLQRYADGQDCRRRRMAWWIDHNFLRHFDPVGYHVKWPEDKADPKTYLSHITQGAQGG
jgi:hypothetical protein